MTLAIVLTLSLAGVAGIIAMFAIYRDERDARQRRRIHAATLAGQFDELNAALADFSDALVKALGPPFIAFAKAFGDVAEQIRKTLER